MKYRCGLDWLEIYKIKSQWHQWFAWHPVRVASRDGRWLEWVERRGTYRFTYPRTPWKWEYRPLGGGKADDC